MTQNERITRLIYGINSGELQVDLHSNRNIEYVEDVHRAMFNNFILHVENEFLLSEEAKDFISRGLTVDEYLKEKFGITDRPLRIQILEYLKKESAIDQKIEIATPFLLLDDSTENRRKISLALDNLLEEKFIRVDGYPHYISETNGGRHPGIGQTGVRASITESGLSKLEAVKRTEDKPTVSNVYNLQNSFQATIGDSNQSSIIANKILTTPTIINETSTSKSATRRILEGVAIAIIGTLLAAILIWYFHFNAVRN